MPTTKQLKIQSHFSRRRYDYKEVPELRMSGLWLRQAGFEIGHTVEIEISDNQLILKSKQL